MEINIKDKIVIVIEKSKEAIGTVLQIQKIRENGEDLIFFQVELEDSELFKLSFVLYENISYINQFEIKKNLGNISLEKAHEKILEGRFYENN